MSSNFTSHEDYMCLALDLAEQARGCTAPNPLVGCVIVKYNKIIGQGFHQKAGCAHAEAAAIKDFQLNYSHYSSLEGSTVYVTLEPCCHMGKTGPCVDLLIQNKIKAVVIAMVDPNPLVAGKGITKLKQAGIDVILGVGEARAQALNSGFISRMSKNRPYIRSKIAASLDGHIALANGESKWITNSLSRQDVHQYRSYSDAIVTTAATVMADNPALTVRCHQSRMIKQPLRVVIDKDLSTDPSAQIYQEQEKAKTIIVSLECSYNDSNKLNKFKELDIEVICLPEDNNNPSKINMLKLWELLAELDCNDVFIEAGGRFNGYLLVNQLVDEWIVYQSGVIMGPGAQNMFGIELQGSMSNLIKLKCEQIKQFEDNWRLILKPCLPE